MAEKNGKIAKLFEIKKEHEFDEICGRTGEAEENESIRKALRIAIAITSVENIDTCRAKELTIKVEFAGETICQSEKLKVTTRNLSVELVGAIERENLDSNFINDILDYPVLMTVYECSTLPSTIPPASASPIAERDSKKRSSKTTASTVSDSATAFPGNILGIGKLDIVDLLTEVKPVRETIVLEPSKKSPIKNSIAWSKLPRLTVVASVDNGEILRACADDHDNILSITLESVYNIPEHIAEGSAYQAVLSVPSFGDESNAISFTNGLVKATKDTDCRKKWWSLVQQIEGPGARTKQIIPLGSHDIFSTLPNDVNLEREMNKSDARIEWNTRKRCFLRRTDSTYFCSKLTKYRAWPIEIMSLDKSSNQKSSKPDKKSKPSISEASSNSDHFMGFLNFSSILYPGVTKVRTATQLLTYSQADLTDKFGGEIIRHNSGTSAATLPKSRGVLRNSRISAEEPEEKREENLQKGLPVTNKDGLPTFIVVEIELWKPFNRPMSPSLLEKDFRSYALLKKHLPHKVTNITLARNCFFKALQVMTLVVSQEYEAFMSSEKYKEIQSEHSNVYFHNYLKCQESFNEAVNCLESKIISYLIEKYGDLRQYDEKMPEVYAALIEETHRIMNKELWTGVCSSFAASKHFDGCLRLFSDEAMEENDFECAKKFLLMNLAKHQNYPDTWLDYAVFNVKNGNYENALEAIREALLLDVYHPIGLLLYGSIMTILKKGSIAEATFLFLVSKHPYFIEGWKLFHFMHSVFQNFEGGNASLQISQRLECEKRKGEGEKENKERKSVMATKKNECKMRRSCFPDSREFTGEIKCGATCSSRALKWTEPLAWTTSLCPPDNANIRTTVLTLQLGLFEFASMALADELLTKKESEYPYYRYYLSVNYYLQGRYNDAVRELEIAVNEYGRDCFLWSLLGHCFYKMKDHVNALACYEYVAESFDRPNDIHLIYLRMGFYYLEKKKFSCAKQIFVAGCKYSSTPLLWKGIGIACLSLNEYEEAETAFIEANYLDSKDPDTWGYLALVNGYLERLDLLMHCYAEAKKRKLNNCELQSEIIRCINLNNLKPEN